MGPFTERLIYPLSPTPLPAPPVLLLGNKSAACSSATCTGRPLAPALSLTGEQGPALSPAPGGRQGHRLAGAGAPRCFISLRTAGAMLPVSCPLPRGCHPPAHTSPAEEDGDWGGMQLVVGTWRDAGVDGVTFTMKVHC